MTTTVFVVAQDDLEYNKWEYSMPRFRYQSWDDVKDNDTLEDQAEKVGYDRNSWNTFFENPIEVLAFEDLQDRSLIEGSKPSASNPKRVLENMGYSEETWDCWINHFEGYDWFEMEEFDIVEQYEALGWDERAWNSINEKDWPSSDEKGWDDLDSDEREGAINLCYFRETWDDEVELSEYEAQSDYFNSVEPWNEEEEELPSLPPLMSLCFPGDATVIVENVGVTPVSQLQLGDSVLVDTEGNYESIYTFGHYEEPSASKITEFTKIITRGSKELILSPSHMVQTSSKTIPAMQIKKGDSLVSATSKDVTVRSVETIRLKNSGMYAPFTPSGYLVVNDMVVSNYVSLQAGEAKEYLAITKNVITPFTHQWIAHSMNAPHRMYCRLLACTKETYDDRGISKSISLPFTISEYIMASNTTFVQALFLLLVIVLSSIFSIAEYFLLSNPTMTTLVTATTIVFLRRNKKNVQ